MERPGYHEQLSELQKRFGGSGTISLADAADYVGVDRRTLLRDRTFPVKKMGRAWRVPLVGFARWLL